MRSSVVEHLLQFSAVFKANDIVYSVKSVAMNVGYYADYIGLFRTRVWRVEYPMDSNNQSQIALVESFQSVYVYVTQPMSHSIAGTSAHRHCKLSSLCTS